MNRNKQLLCYFLMLFICVGNYSISYGQGWIKYFDHDSAPSPSYAGYDKGITTIISTTDGGHIFSVRSHQNFQSLTKVDQDGSIQWENAYFESYPTLQSPSVHEIIELNDGYVLCGYYLQFPGSNLTPYLMKVDKFGSLLWERTYNFEPYYSDPKNHIVSTSDGGFLFASLRLSLVNTATVVKTNNIGDIEWQREFSIAEDILKIIPISNSTFEIVVQEPNVPSNQNPESDCSIYKMDIYGNLLDTIYIDADPLSNNTYMTDVVKEPNGDHVFVGKNVTSLYIYKTDSIGNLKWEKDFNQIQINANNHSKIIKADNGYIISAYNRFATQGPSEAIAIKIDDSGNLLWKKVFPGLFRDVANTNDNSYVFVGHSSNIHSSSSGLHTAHLVKLDDNGHLYDNYLAGNVFIDQNLNCAIDQSEPGLNKWLLEAEGNQTFYALTDSMGNYKMDVDTGSYDLRIVTQGPLWNSCTPTTTIQVNTNDSILTDFPHQALYDCPYLTIDISTPFLRRCFPNNYTVSYCNQGTTPSSNTSIEIEFHPHLDVTSSSVPWTSQVGNTFTFPIGSLNINECGSFVVTATPNCDSTIIGQTLCVYATILPDSICAPPTTAWDGSITDLEVSCGVDSLTFTIKNIGSGDMAIPLEYFVIEDNLIDKQGFYDLDAMESMELKFPANGTTYRLYAKQASGYFPTGYYPTIAYEGCGTNTNGTFSMGYINMFPENNVLNTETVDCQELLGAFDPNDKQATPKGYGPEHYIEVGDDIEYKIRFQNTGNDTAFTVVIRDTISADLDIATLLPGASSHPYQLDIINGRTLKFTFSNILLVDSFTNEPLSHGFVKFKISQQPSLPLGTTIYNSAAIYFDFNEPVITNKTFHEIGEDFIPVVVTSVENAEFPNLNVQVQPNPFVDYARFILENAPSGKKTFELYDATGKLLLKDTFSEDSSYLMHKQGLQTGIYFYKILTNNKLLASGKLIAGN